MHGHGRTEKMRVLGERPHSVMHRTCTAGGRVCFNFHRQYIFLDAEVRIYVGHGFNMNAGPSSQ
jgi:hypothetical protein